MAVIAALRPLRRRSGRRLRLASQGLHPPMTSWVPDPVRLIVAIHSHTTEPVTVPCRPRSRSASAPNPAAGAATAGALTIQGSQTGSQCRQTSGHIRPPPAMVFAASWPTRPHLAPCGDAADAPEKGKSPTPTPPTSSVGDYVRFAWPGRLRGRSGWLDSPLHAVTPGPPVSASMNKLPI